MHTPTTLSTEYVTEAAQLLCEPGSRKVWVADLYQVACPLSTDLEAFKSWLVGEHRAGRLVLTRADVARAAEADLADASEVSYLNATWHQLVVR